MQRDSTRWRPLLEAVLARHGLSVTGAAATGTYPTFLCGDAVLKLFCGTDVARQAFAAERAALERVAVDPEIPAPRVLDAGVEAETPYLLLTRARGAPLERSAPSGPERRAIAADLGRIVARVHRLDPAGIADAGDWAAPSIEEAASRSSLPAHLAEQAPAFVASIAPRERVVVHADLTASHVFSDGGRVTGLIDWGDAVVADRHHELIQLYRAALGCDRGLLHLALDAMGWRPDPRRALAFALRRQAIGLAQHRSMDVFEPLAARFPLDEIPTLDTLAELLFGR